MEDPRKEWQPLLWEPHLCLSSAFFCAWNQLVINLHAHLKLAPGECNPAISVDHLCSCGSGWELCQHLQTLRALALSSAVRVHLCPPSSHPPGEEEWAMTLDPLPWDAGKSIALVSYSNQATPSEGSPPGPHCFGFSQNCMDGHFKTHLPKMYY